MIPFIPFDIFRNLTVGFMVLFTYDGSSTWIVSSEASLSIRKPGPTASLSTSMSLIGSVDLCGMYAKGRLALGLASFSLVVALCLNVSLAPFYESGF